MSRIGKKPIVIPSNVKIALSDKYMEAKGPNGSIEILLPEGIVCEQKENLLMVKKKEEDQLPNAMYGTMRAHIANAIKGVAEGFFKELEIVGVGYKCQLQGNTMIFNLGYTNPREIKLPDGMKIIFDEKNKNKFKVWGIDKQKVGQIAALMRGFRKPDPYKGKGVRYTNEVIKLKAGKIAGAK